MTRGKPPLDRRSVSSHADPDHLVRFHLLGALRVFSAPGSDLLPRSHKARGLVAYLAMANGRSVRRTRIAGLLWDRVPEDQARNSLRQALAELSALFAVCPAPVIEAGREEIRLRAERCWIDLAVLDAPENHDGSRELLVPAESILLDELDGISVSFDHWLAEERARVEGRIRDLFHARINYLLASGASPDQQAGAARGLLAFDPANEQAWRTMIHALVDLGDTARALHEFRRCEETLRRLLDISPSEETARLGRMIRNNNKNPEPEPGHDAGLAPGPAGPFRERVIETSMEGTPASIVVLPFLSLGHSTTDMAWFSAGLTEGIIHVLSGLGDLFVIGRGTSLSYADRPVDPREAGRELGVSYVMTGLVQATAERRVRVFIELVETSTGRILKSQQHDVELTDLFELQDNLSLEIVSIIAPTMRNRDLVRARHKPPASLTAYELSLRGQSILYKLSPPSFGDALKLFHQAIMLDSTYALAFAHAATWHNFRIAQGWSPDPAEDAEQAQTMAIAALELDPDNAIALAIRGQVLSFVRRDYTGARHFLDHALAMGPSCALAWTLSSTTHGWTGDGSRAIAHAERALKLSPFDPFVYFAQHMLSQGHYVAGNYQEAVSWGKKAAAGNGRLTSNLRTLTAALVASGDLAGARECAAALLTIEPGFRLSDFIRRTAFGPALREPHAARLRVAGLPD